MKKVLFFMLMVLIFQSCSSSKEAAMTGNDSKKSRRLANEEIIKKAVESRKYVIKFHRLLVPGGYIDLIPKSNFVIINGNIASVSLMYSGRSIFSRPISAINFNGHTVNYQMKSEGSKGLYSIKTKVNKGADNFDFYISIGTGGSCSLSVVNPNIESVTYYGQLTPIPSEEELIPGEKGRM